MMKTIVLIILCLFTVSCSERKPKDLFSQALDYCEMTDGDDGYCNLGIHQKTLDEIKLVYGVPIDSYIHRMLSLDMNPDNYENGNITDRSLCTIYTNYKGKMIPSFLCCTWDLGVDNNIDEEIWLRIYFAEDGMKQYRAIYGEIAEKKVFFLE